MKARVWQLFEVCQHEFANFSLPCEGRFRFRVRTRSCACADNAKIVRRRYAQCNTKLTHDDA